MWGQDEEDEYEDEEDDRKEDQIKKMTIVYSSLWPVEPSTVTVK